MPPRASGERRDFHKEYQRRRELAERRGFSISQARGHPKPGEVGIRTLASEPRWTVTILADEPARLVTLELGYRDAQRAGRYDELTQRLKRGEITPTEFHARARRMEPIGGLQPLADPHAVLALTVVTDPDEFVFDSGPRSWS